MSIVVAIHVGNELLFVADKRVVHMDPDGFVITSHDNGIKILPAFTGVIGLVGNTDLALQLLKTESVGVSSQASDQEIANRLLSAYAQIFAGIIKTQGSIEKAREELEKKGSTAFLYGSCTEAGCRLVAFQAADMFRAEVKYDSVTPIKGSHALYGEVTSAGIDRNGMALQHWFKKDVYTLTDAKRLALLMCRFAHKTEPTLVGPTLDMFLLKAGGVLEKLEYKTDEAWVTAFVDKTGKDFFAP